MDYNVPALEIGILFSPIIHFRLNGIYKDQESGLSYSGDYTIRCKAGKYLLGNKEITLPLILNPEDYQQNDFDLLDVVIGINFHWERKENQKFRGSLKIIDEGPHLTAINILQLEDYLLSVISSEMSATSSVEFLKAHAVISRSWLLAQKAKASAVNENYTSCISTSEEYIRWYDREDHHHFDVCADDHCQRYQGISRAYTPIVKIAVQETAGEILTNNGKICDTRFSKCCGGITERFDNTWEPISHPYLVKVSDSAKPLPTVDLTNETEAGAWIQSSPDVFCNTTDKKILSDVLNDYDQETQHFFRWTEKYTTKELSALVKKRINIDFGTITDITPIERGVSGRIIKLRISGTAQTKIIGKELIIRKAFSESHLYSSAFIVEKTTDGFLLKGAGWGHGVGLCQIGAAVMGAQGYRYREILSHYFPESKIKKIEHSDFSIHQ